MKIIFRILILVILISGCSGNRYLLTDKGKDKRFLIDAIEESTKTGEVSKRPMIVVDGVPYRYDQELKNKRLQLSKNDIEKIERLKRDKGVEIYGKSAQGGLLIVTTKLHTAKDPKPIDESKVLMLLEDKEISKSELDKINANDVESVDIFKDKETVKKYTSENYDGVVIIHLKKK